MTQGTTNWMQIELFRDICQQNEFHFRLQEYSLLRITILRGNCEKKIVPTQHELIEHVDIKLTVAPPGTDRMGL